MSTVPPTFLSARALFWSTMTCKTTHAAVVHFVQLLIPNWVDCRHFIVFFNEDNKTDEE